jgi:hypothetical protein
MNGLVRDAAGLQAQFVRLRESAARYRTVLRNHQPLAATYAIVFGLYGSYSRDRSLLRFSFAAFATVQRILRGIHRPGLAG